MNTSDAELNFQLQAEINREKPTGADNAEGPLCLAPPPGSALSRENAVARDPFPDEILMPGLARKRQYEAVYEAMCARRRGPARVYIETRAVALPECFRDIR